MKKLNWDNWDNLTIEEKEKKIEENEKIVKDLYEKLMSEMK